MTPLATTGGTPATQCLLKSGNPFGFGSPLGGIAARVAALTAHATLLRNALPPPCPVPNAQKLHPLAMP